jgi:hypothetical protein
MRQVEQTEVHFELTIRPVTGYRPGEEPRQVAQSGSRSPRNVPENEDQTVAAKPQQQVAR